MTRKPSVGAENYHFGDGPKLASTPDESVLRQFEEDRIRLARDLAAAELAIKAHEIDTKRILARAAKLEDDRLALKLELKAVVEDIVDVLSCFRSDVYMSGQVGNLCIRYRAELAAIVNRIRAQGYYAEEIERRRVADEIAMRSLKL